MTPVLSIVGRSGSGKTTLLVKLVRRLSRKGRRIGTIKHDAHNFEIDRPGKDSYRHFHAGSGATLIACGEKLAFVERLKKPLSLNSLVSRFFRGFDLVITEGFKRGDKPKLEIVRSAVSNAPLCRPRGDNLAALVSDIQIHGYTQPKFGLNEIGKIAAFIERKFLCRKKQAAGTSRK